MTHIIVGIHGLANKPPADTLADWWDTSIREGLIKNCGVHDAGYELKMVYWADLLYKTPLHQDKNFDFDDLYNDEPYCEALKGALKTYKDSWLDDARGTVLGVGGAAIDQLKRRFGMDALADKLLGLVLKDLAYYYDKDRFIHDREGNEATAREVLMDTLKTALLPLKGRRILLIAHSMGSIIAYDVLRNLGREDSSFELAQFVTIGSPLGLPHVKLNVHEERSRYDKKTPVRTPTIVTESWVNYADRKDKVALDVYLHGDYVANARGIEVRDDLVNNDYVGPNAEANHHKSYGYLRTPELSEQIHAFITS